jgi:hypothetical protein
MFRTTMEVRLIGIVAVLFSYWALHMKPIIVNDLPDSYKSPVLALELANKKEDINKIVSIPEARDFISKQLGQDTFFILLYVLLLGSLGIFVTRLIPGGFRAGWIATAFVIAAGILDLLENRGMRKAVDSKESATEALVNSIRYPSLGKWGLFYLSVLLIGLLLLWKAKLLFIDSPSFVSSAIFLVCGLSFAVAALLGLSAVVANLIEAKFYPMFPWAQQTMGLGILIVAIVFTLLPRLVMRE